MSWLNVRHVAVEWIILERSLSFTCECMPPAEPYGPSRSFQPLYCRQRVINDFVPAPFLLCKPPRQKRACCTVSCLPDDCKFTPFLFKRLQRCRFYKMEHTGLVQTPRVSLKMTFHQSKLPSVLVLLHE